MKEWDRHNIRMSLVQWEHGSERRAQSKLVQFYKKGESQILISTRMVSRIK